MKYFCFKSLAFLLIISIFNYCSSDSNNSSILGKWQMNGNTQYGLEFTNYGIVILKHSPYTNQEVSYTKSGKILTIGSKTGQAIFSNGGNKLTISGFSNPSSFGTEGAVGPFINGVYIRQP